MNRYLKVLFLVFMSNGCFGSEVESWMKSYKVKSKGFYLISIFDGAIAVPNVFHLSLFADDHLVLQGIDDELKNLGLINYAKSEGNQEVNFKLTNEKRGSCYGLTFKRGLIDNNPMTMVTDGAHVLFVSSDLEYLPQLLFMPMEERANANSVSCEFLYE